MINIPFSLVCSVLKLKPIPQHYSKETKSKFDFVDTKPKKSRKTLTLNFMHHFNKLDAISI